MSKRLLIVIVSKRLVLGCLVLDRAGHSLALLALLILALPFAHLQCFRLAGPRDNLLRRATLARARTTGRRLTSPGRLDEV